MTSSAFVEVTSDKRGIGWKLISPAKLDEHAIKALRPESAEAALGTAEFVFLYCGQFRYPETQVGFLFATVLEKDRSDDCEASPFDSGALHRKSTWPDTSETAIAFLARHTLPVPGYREYLAHLLHFQFASPADYVAQNKQPMRPDSIGLRPKSPAVENDPRLWSFEIRVRNEVILSAPHLKVLFYPRRLRREKTTLDFLVAMEGHVELEQVVMEDDGDFATLQSRCIDYLRANGIV
ncbi:MAG: hypothetical protein HY736_26575 [Verrucomicrobia bacterium]|nr:hypothetical protein [Verrucomicrobiota bacterium]